MWKPRDAMHCSYLEVWLETKPFTVASPDRGACSASNGTWQCCCFFQVERLQEVQRETDGGATASKKRRTILTQSLR